jgi:hypothetical protein
VPRHALDRRLVEQVGPPIRRPVPVALCHRQRQSGCRSNCAAQRAGTMPPPVRDAACSAAWADPNSGLRSSVRSGTIAGPAYRTARPGLVRTGSSRGARQQWSARIAPLRRAHHQRVHEVAITSSMPARLRPAIELPTAIALPAVAHQQHNEAAGAMLQGCVAPGAIKTSATRLVVSISKPTAPTVTGRAGRGRSCGNSVTRPVEEVLR